MATHVKKIDTDIVWGTQVALGAGKGIVISCEAKSTVKVADILDGEGALADAVFHDQREEVTVEILASQAATKPKPGTELDFGGVTAVIVTESSWKWASGEGKKLSITGLKSVK
jgi:hypothetical protein